jgi:two-component system probable response regulator PhcQ
MENIVLLVDDEQNILHGLARALRLQPYQLYTATSGEEAMLILKGHNVDVIVSDEQMPGMCGGDLLAWVADNYPEVMRIVLTGHPTVETAIRAINEGAVYQYFIKPCNPAILGVAIRKALEHKALLVENRQLLDVNRRQMQELEDYRRDLEVLTGVVSQDIQEPLQTVARSCQSLGEQYRDMFDPKANTLLDNALTGMSEIQRLVDALLEHSRTKARCSPGNAQGVPEKETARSPADR